MNNRKVLILTDCRKKNHSNVEREKEEDWEDVFNKKEHFLLKLVRTALKYLKNCYKTLKFEQKILSRI